MIPMSSSKIFAFKVGGEIEKENNSGVFRTLSNIYDEDVKKKKKIADKWIQQDELFS